jgi:hypothetical protein
MQAEDFPEGYPASAFVDVCHAIGRAQSGILASGYQEKLPMPAVELFHPEPSKQKLLSIKVLCLPRLGAHRAFRNVAAESCTWRDKFRMRL